MGPRASLILNFTVTGVGSGTPNWFSAVTTTLCLPSLYFLVNGDVQGLASLPSTAQVKVEPAIDAANLIVALRFVDVFFGALLTVVSGAGHAAWVDADWGQASWLTSPNPSWSTSGSTTADRFRRAPGPGLSGLNSVALAVSTPFTKTATSPG